MSLMELTPEDLTLYPYPEPADYAPLIERLQQVGERLQEVLGKQRRNAGSPFRRRMDEILRVAPNEDAMIAVMQTRSYILPLLALWRDEGDTDTPLQPTPGLLAHVELLGNSSTRERVSRLALRDLFLIFFSKYDTLQHFDAMCATLQSQLNRYAQRELLFGLDKFKEEAPQLLKPDGHKHLAALTNGSGQTLAQIAQAHGITIQNSRFFEAAQLAYYVVRLERLLPNEENEESKALLKEVQDDAVYSKRLDGNNCLGHAVLRILIDKLREAGQTPSDLWRGTLLAIGGDPRVAPTMRSYRDWWRPLGPHRVQQMIEWLSEQDLNLFLQLFEELSKTNAAMKRMFPARTRFLRGLLDKKLIRETRLFLSGQAADYVKRNWQAKERPVFVSIAGGAPGFVAFYLNLDTAHMVEGTHSFALRIMDKIPSQSPILSFDRSVSHDHLTDLEEMYQQEPGNKGLFERVVHWPEWKPNSGKDNSWQEKAVNHLRKKLGVAVLLSDVT